MTAEWRCVTHLLESSLLHVSCIAYTNRTGGTATLAVREHCTAQQVDY